MTTLSYIYMAESYFKSIRWNCVVNKGICLIWSRGRLFSPSLSCWGQGIGKQRGTISGWHKRTASRNLVVHRHGTTLRQSVQRYRCRLHFSLFFSHFDIKAGKSPEDMVKEDIERKTRKVMGRKKGAKKKLRVYQFFYLFIFFAPSLRKLSFSRLLLLAWAIVIINVRKEELLFLYWVLKGYGLFDPTE